MTAGARLAVVVTNYNYERYLASAIDSALAQDGVEVIVVDDGSTDGSAEVLRRYAHSVRLVEQPNGGQGAAFNAGFRHVTAPVVVFLDADDVLAHGMTQRLERAFADSTVARVQFPLALIDGNGSVLEGSMPRDPSGLARGDVRSQLIAAPDDLSWQPTSGNAFRSSVLDAILPMPTAPYRICADYYLSNLSAAHGKVVVLEETGGSYRIHAANNHFDVTTSMTRLRENVIRTRATNILLLDHCRQLGLADAMIAPDDLRSVTAIGHRLISLRLEPDQHPIASDTRMGLIRLGVGAAFRRPGSVLIRRIVMAVWFVAVGLVPRRLVARVARPLVRVEEVGR